MDHSYNDHVPGLRLGTQPESCVSTGINQQPAKYPSSVAAGFPTAKRLGNFPLENSQKRERSKRYWELKTKKQSVWVEGAQGGARTQEFPIGKFTKEKAKP